MLLRHRGLSLLYNIVTCSSRTSMRPLRALYPPLLHRLAESILLSSLCNEHEFTQKHCTNRRRNGKVFYRRDSFFRNSLIRNHFLSAFVIMNRGWSSEDLCSNSLRGQEHFFFSRTSRANLGPTSFMWDRYWGRFPRGKADGALKVVTPLNLVPTLTKRGATSYAMNVRVHS